jgi:hypothetical protein
MTKKLNIMIIAFLALVSCMIAPVCAETLTGTLGSTSQNQTAYVLGHSGEAWESTGLMGVLVNNIEFSPGTLSLIRFDNGFKPNYGAGLLDGNTTTFEGKIGTDVICTGTMGYQRLFDNAWPTPNELDGYQYITFDTWNVSAYTGTQTIAFTYDPWELTGLTVSRANTGSVPSGSISLGTNYGYFPIGSYLITKDVNFLNEYTATKPAGAGISGTVTKLVGGILYNSRAYITDGSTGASLTSQGTMTSVAFNFSVPAESIGVNVQDSSLNWWNSSILFAATVPTVTPTPTTTIPAGYVRNNLYIWDQNDAQISGADIDVLDVEAATWTNRTADADGWITIDTLPYHTVNIYAHYPTSNIYLPNEILGLETGYYGGHNWVLVLYPYVSTPSGYVTLYINTRNYDTKAVLTGVNLQIKNLVTGATTGESTGSTDSASTVVTNATNYQITGSKAGYLSKTVVINSGEAASKTVVLELSKATVTTAPTSTIPPGGVTPVITVDPSDPSLHGGDTSMKAQEMMNWLAMNGMMLVQLCFLVTVFALLGIKFGK